MDKLVLRSLMPSSAKRSQVKQEKLGGVNEHESLARRARVGSVVTRAGLVEKRELPSLPRRSVQP